MIASLEILYLDDAIVVVNKPHDLLVHRTKLATADTQFAMQMTRNQIGQHVYPVHRLDRKTGGVLLFALSSAIAHELQLSFQAGNVVKQYMAIVRGYFPGHVELDYALEDDRGIVQEAQTTFDLIKTTELAIPNGKFATSRYSLISAQPHTGRLHQIRKHLKHLFHPIIGDRPHGCNKQNKFFLEQWQMQTTMLHASSLQFPHPVSKKILKINAKLHHEFIRVLDFLGLEDKPIGSA